MTEKQDQMEENVLEETPSGLVAPDTAKAPSPLPEAAAPESGASEKVAVDEAESDAAAPETDAAEEAVPESDAAGDAVPEAVVDEAEAKAETTAGEAESDPTGSDATPPEKEAKPSGPRKRWYVVHTYSGHENKVRANLERAIQYAKMQDKFGEILVATEDYAVMKAGKKRITKRKTFPSYVLLEMFMNDETRALVTNIPGVTHFVGDRQAAPLTEAEVRRIRGQEVKEKGIVSTEVPFKVGESVKVTDGPFADFVGTVDEINPERGKLRVMVSIFGRPTAVELDIVQVTGI